MRRIHIIFYLPSKNGSIIFPRPIHIQKETLSRTWVFLQPCWVTIWLTFRT